MFRDAIADPTAIHRPPAPFGRPTVAQEERSFMPQEKAAGKPGATILHPEFADRLRAVAGSHPDVPPSNYGRLGWFSDEFAKLGDVVSNEMVRKYFAGENKPRDKRMRLLAQILGVDEAWLSLGKSADTQTKRASIRNAQASGVVNIVAGLIEMHGGSPAFPEQADSRAKREGIDLYAIIRGAQYAMHVALAESTEQGLLFSLPPGLGENVIVLGVSQSSPLCFEIVELDAEGLANHGKRGKTATEVLLDASGKTDGYEWRRVESFAKRL